MRCGSGATTARSFFVTEDALKKIQPDMRRDEAGLLRAFDRNLAGSMRPQSRSTAALAKGPTTCCRPISEPHAKKRCGPDLPAYGRRLPPHDTANCLILANTNRIRLETNTCLRHINVATHEGPCEPRVGPKIVFTRTVSGSLFIITDNPDHAGVSSATRERITRVRVCRSDQRKIEF
jgi:hypothetical protein